LARKTVTAAPIDIETQLTLFGLPILYVYAIGAGIILLIATGCFRLKKWH
jgi:hypothetical protein